MHRAKGRKKIKLNLLKIMMESKLYPFFTDQEEEPEIPEEETEKPEKEETSEEDEDETSDEM